MAIICNNIIARHSFNEKPVGVQVAVDRLGVATFEFECGRDRQHSLSGCDIILHVYAHAPKSIHSCFPKGGRLMTQ